MKLFECRDYSHEAKMYYVELVLRSMRPGDRVVTNYLPTSKQGESRRGG